MNCKLKIVLTQRLPANNCGNLFRYERQGDHWIGHVTPTQDGLTDAHWALRFMSHGTDQPGDVSNLAPYPDRETAHKQMRDGGRGESYVRFEGYQDELPKLVRIDLNGQVLCSGSEYGLPSSTKTRRLHMSVSSTTSSAAGRPAQTISRTSTSTRTSNSCGDILKYERQGDQYIGHVTSPQPGLTDVQWKLRFMSRGVDQIGTVSSLAPYPNKESALQQMSDGGRAESFVRFNGYQSELPKIVSIELNGQVLCTASEYDVPSRTMTREQHMSVSSTNSNGGTESRPNIARIPSITTEVDTHQEPAADECGLEGFAGLQYGGETVPRGRFPWLAALYHNSNLDSKKVDLDYKCVTTLISRRSVITAAHCIYDIPPSRLRVYVGRHDVTIHPEKDATLMAVESVRTHPDFVGNLVPDSDLGLLVLTEQVQYSLYVRPICLWSSNTELNIDDSEQAAVAGWGVDTKLKPTRFPMTVNVKPVSREECLRQMVTARDFLTPRTLCAGNSQGHGPCLGDSGGGLMVLRNNRWMVRGIVSLAQRAGNGCELSKFVIYCDVARHLSWIQQHVE